MLKAGIPVEYAFSSEAVLKESRPEMYKETVERYLKSFHRLLVERMKEATVRRLDPTGRRLYTVAKWLRGMK